MALETGVDIKIEVSGEKLLKQAFDSVRLAAKGLESQGVSLDRVLSKLTSSELKTAETYRKSSDTFRGLQKETVNLARQYEFLSKFSGITAKEARMLALAQDDLIKKSKELNIHGAARTTYIESQNKKIVEQIRLNNQLKNSIDSLTGSSIASGKVIQNVPNQVNRMNNSFTGLGLNLKQLLPTLGGIGLTGVLTTVGITALRTADTMSLLRSRINLVKDASEDFNEVYRRLVDTAINNRSSLQDTATLYVRLTPALRAAGVEASAATKVIDSFQKTLLISGATTRETSSAILQFSQAMAAGRLNGDEFRSISEAAPEFLRAFSRATGVAAGALKELAADGKLTTEVITAAMVIMNDELTRTAANIELTFSQSMTILSTRLSEFVDRANQATGATAALAGFTTDLSDIVKELNTSFSLLDTVSVNESLREMSPEAQAIGYIFETLAVVFLNTGFVLKTLVDTAVTGARQFKALVTGDLDGALKLGDEYNQRAKEGAAFVEKLSNALVGATQRAAQARSELVQTRQSLLDMGYSASEMSGSLDGGSDSTKFLSKEMQDALAIIEKFKKGLSSSGKEAEKFAKIQKRAIDSLLDNLTKLEDQYSNYGGKIDDVERSEREIVKAFESGITSAAQYTEQIIRLSRVRQARSEIEYAEAQAQAAVEMNKVLEASDKQTEAYKDQVAEIEEQILKVGKQEKALLALELAKIDDIIATKQQKIEMNSFGDANDTLIGQYKEQIVELEKLKKAKSKLYETQEAQKVIEANAKIAKQLEDDIVRAFEKSFLEGADLAEGLKNAIKATFAKEVFRIFVQPVVGGLVSTFSGIFGGGGSDGSGSGTGGIGGLVSGGGSIFDSLGSFGSGFGTDAGTFADGFLAIGDKIANTFGDSALSDAIINNSELLGKVSAGLAAVGTGLSVFDSLKNGQYGSAIGEGLGYAFGGSIGGAVGKFLGGFVDKIFGFGGGKISATALPASFGQNVVANLNEQYSNIVSSLGGTALTGVSFGAGGNTGRQGQNPNFTIGASIGGRGVFNSANTREGQADGLFLSGEIALNEANLADQSLRALFSVLKETDFADNIDAVIDSVDTFGDSFEKLQMALADAQLLKTINEEFPKLGGALATLAGQSIETVKTFVLLAGGFENLKNLQNAYISAIYSEEEKLALATQNLETAFEALGISVPATTAEYKALVDAQNLTTVEGQATYVALLQLAGAFKEVKDAQQQALEEQIAEQERLLEEQQRAAEEAAEALRELAEAYDEVRKKTQDYISEITNGALSSLERNAKDIAEVMNQIGSEQDAMERIALEGELSDLIFERYQLEKQQIEELQAVISEVFSSIQSEAESVNQARDAILGVQTTTGSRQSIAQRISQATGGVAFNATAAQANLTAEVERFKTSSLNAVSVLGKLREETVRYYEQQKALSELMKGTASSIRASISQVQFADLTPQQQLQNLEAQFASLYATALTSSGSTLADTGTQLQALIGPLLEKASEIYASGPEFQRIKELVLGQAGTVADKLDALAPENYQQESLSLLDQIDQSLIGLKTQADLANQALIASLETASDRAVAALNNLMLGLLGPQVPVTTQPVTQPALNAPVATLASAEFSGNSATTGGSFGAIVDELKALREDVKNSGDIQIKVVTTDGRVLVDETLTQIKNRSKRGELVIFADGVK